jgi:hypothetical protein
MLRAHCTARTASATTMMKDSDSDDDAQEAATTRRRQRYAPPALLIHIRQQRFKCGARIALRAQHQRRR